MKPKCDIVYDESGTIFEDIFFQFLVQYDDSVISDERDASWTVVSIQDVEGLEPDSLWAEVVTQAHTYKYVYDCPVSRKHETQYFVKIKEIYTDLFGGSDIFEFVPDSIDNIVVSEKFMERLKKTGLSGIQFQPLEINENQSDTEEAGDPDLNLLEFTGKIFHRPCKLLVKPNACPFCGFGPLVCTTCGATMPDCHRCDKHTMKLWSGHPSGNDKQLKFADVPQEGRILQGSSWDGKDFVQANGVNYVTKRALNWLLCVHAKPFYVRPARLLIDGMSVEQKKWMKRAQEPLIEGMSFSS